MRADSGANIARPGETPPAPSSDGTAGLRGSNQSVMRAYNERLVLSLLRHEGPLAKSDIARITGLSAQTVSVIMRGLESDGLLARGTPVRGRVGQPSVPMSLAADGAYFFGLKIGRRSVDLVLIDFLGAIVAQSHATYPYPRVDTVVEFVAAALPELTRTIGPGHRDRIGGLGIAMPFQLWNWAQFVGAESETMADWRRRDIQAEIARLCPFPVFVQNDATAACGAELVFGSGERRKDFLYFYIASFIGGGLVLNGQLFTGRGGNAAALGSMPVPGPDGGMRQLISVASMASLEGYMRARGLATDPLWQTPPEWTVPDEILARWLDEVTRGLAHATVSALSVVEFDTVLIDGWLPAPVRAAAVEGTRAALARCDLAGLDPPRIEAGSLGGHARQLGAASIPLSQRYLIDQSVFLKD